MIETTDMTDGQYRRIYAGYISSRKISKLTLGAEAWFWRLHSLADDYGNLYGDPALIWKYASGRRNITVKEAERLTQEVLAANLAYAYYDDEDVYIHIIGFEKKQVASNRNGKRVQRFPMHPDEESADVNTTQGALRKSGILEDGQRCNRKILAQQEQEQEQYQEQDQIILPEAAVAAPASELPKLSSPKKPRTEKQVERDSLFEAVAKAFFPSGQSKDDASLIGKTVTALKAKQATPEEIPRRLARWPTLYPDAGPLTPPGLAKHWDALNGRAITPTPKPRRNEGIEDESQDFVYQRAMKKWKQDNGIADDAP